MVRKLVLVAALAVSALAWGCGDRTSNNNDTDVIDGKDTLIGTDLKGKDLVGFDMAQLDQAGTDTTTGQDTPWLNDGWVAPDGWVPPTDPGQPPVEDTEIMKVQKSDASTKCVDGTAFTNGATDIAMDVIVVSPQYVASKDSTTGNPKLFGYFVADANVSQVWPWGGIALIIDAVQNPTFAVGDVLSVVADHTEYYCFSQVKAKSFQAKGQAAVPAAFPADPADLAQDAEGKQDAARAEALEGVLVTFTDVEVTKTPSLGSDGADHGAFEVAGGVIVDDDWKLTYRNNRKVGDKFSRLTGVVKYSYGKYYVAPRGDDDVVLAGQQPGDQGGTQDVIEPVDGQETVNPGTGIAAIQQSDASAKCVEGTAFTNGDTGLTLDVVVVSPQYVASKDSTTGNPKLYGYFVADANVSQVAPWGGIALVIDVAMNPAFAVGDVLHVTGDHTDYYCFSQLKATSVEKTSTATVPAPLVISPADLAQDAGGVQDPAKAEPLEGVLVKMVNVTVTKTPSLGSDGKDHGAFEVAGGVIVEDDWAHGYTRTLGDTFASITGVVKYSFGKYYVAPRGAEDLVLGTPGEDLQPDVAEDVVQPTEDVVQPTEDVVTPTEDVVQPTTKTVTEIQGAAASTGCTNEAGSDTILSGVALKGVVITSPKFSASAGLHGYYVADPAGGNTNNGVYVVIGKTAATAFAPGDVVDIVGDLLEYYCLTEININTTKGGSMTKTGTANIPAPVVLDAALLANGGTGDKAAVEPYEGMIVTVQNVAVTANPAADTKNWFEVGTGIGIAKDFTYAADTGGTAPFTGTAPAVGTQLTSITGALKYTYGKYRIAPRTDADLVLTP